MSSKAEMKRLLRERRRAVREQLRDQRQRLKEARGKRPEKKWLRIVLLALLLLLLLLRYCSCEEPPKPEGPVSPVVVEPKKKKKKPVPPPKKKPIERRTKRRERPAYESAEKKKKSWLDDFRLQVAGRSLRLASCFEGVERPGAVKWVAAVDPASGMVTDHQLAPVASSIALSSKQKRCIVQVLSDPPYRLIDSDAPPTPERVGLVLEF